MPSHSNNCQKLVLCIQAKSFHIFSDSLSPTLCCWCDSECGRLSYSMMADCQLSCWWGKEVGWLLSCPAGHRKNTRGGHTN